MADHLDRVFEREHAGDVRRRDLAHAVTDHDVGLETPGTQHCGDTDLNRENGGLRDCDVIVMLRLQSERMKGALLPSAGEYFKQYGLTQDKLALARPDAIVMHPGPMNRGVEIDSAVADGARSVILPQVTFGIAVRMAVLSIIASH